jgi:hypothetical protein
MASVDMNSEQKLEMDVVKQQTWSNFSYRRGTFLVGFARNKKIVSMDKHSMGIN